MGHGDLFPLPNGSVEPRPRCDLSRGVRQRVQRHRFAQTANENAIIALNSLAGFLRLSQIRRGSLLTAKPLCVIESRIALVSVSLMLAPRKNP